MESNKLECNLNKSIAVLWQLVYKLAVENKFRSEDSAQFEIPMVD